MADAMRVAISGASGLIGGALSARLTAAGHDVVRMVRRRADAGPDDVYYSGRAGEIDAEALVGVDAVVHLAGEPIGARRWSDEARRLQTIPGAGPIVPLTAIDTFPAPRARPLRDLRRSAWPRHPRNGNGRRP